MSNQRRVAELPRLSARTATTMRARPTLRLAGCAGRRSRAAARGLTFLSGRDPAGFARLLGNRRARDDQFTVAENQ